MDRRHADEVRAVVQLTRWTLVMLHNAEQGLIPLRALERTVDGGVLDALGPITPRPPGQPRTPPRVGRLRVHLVHDQLVHVAAVTARPDGRPSGVVLELRREQPEDAWRITELSRVEDRRVIGPHSQHLNRDNGTRRLPSDLTATLRVAEHARDAAEAARDNALARAEQLRDRLTELQRHTPREVRERISVTEQERRARLDAARWHRTLRTTNEELRELYDVADLREARRLVITADPLMSVRKPVHLERLLGSIPHDRDERAAWRQAASTIERYRQTWGVDDPHDALGPPPPDRLTEQGRQHRDATAAAERYTARQRETAQDLDTGRELTLER